MKSQRNRIRPSRRLLVQQLEDRRLLAGPHAPAAGEIGSTAIPGDDVSIVAWATTVEGYTAGSNVDAEFRTPGKALGPASDDSGDIVSLGRGGEITFSFDAPIRDGLGPDFAVFENGFSDTFLELGFVEVSSDGVNFFRFDNDSLTPSAVDAFGAVDPTNVHNLAGKYRQGFGTPFDLEELESVSPLLNLASVTHVRLIDIVGDGSSTDTSGDPIFDPFPTVGSAGLDVDAVGVIHQVELARDVVGFEDVGATLATGSAFSGPVANGSNIVGPFDDDVVVGSFQSETLNFNNAHSTDFQSWTGWAYSNGTNRTTPGFTNQFSALTGGGAAGSPTYGIGFPDQGDFFGPSTITRESNDSRRFESLKLTNTTYAALSMRDGDAFAKKFGGVSGNDPDFLLLTIAGKDAGDNSVGDIEFYLADYRFANNALDYIVDQWTEVDLRPIAEARTLEFSITSSDVGPFGINTPAYFAADDITLTKPVLPIDIADRKVSESAGADATVVRISRADSDTTSPINVSIQGVDSGIAAVPTSATIPAGERFVEFPVGVVNNDVVEGDRQIVIAASAPGFVGSSRELQIQDDDVFALALSLAQPRVDEGNSLIATVSRNDGDLSTPLVVRVESPEPALLSFDATVTIAAGQASSTFTIIAIEDQIDRPSTSVPVEVSATDYVAASALLDVTDNDEPTVTIDFDPDSYSESQAALTARFEDVGRRLPTESFYNGADLAGGFSSDGIAFNNEFNPTFGSWSGWSYSNMTDTTTPGFSNQYSAFTGVGADGSDTYGVATAYAPPIITRDPSTSDGFQSIAISNTTYAALSMMQGDSFAKRFGGESGDDPDFFLLTIDGIDGDGASIGLVDFYLADFRFTDNSLDYIVDQWTTIDLATLSSAIELRFSLTSSDVGSFGMNTPAYFAADNIVLAAPSPQPTVTIGRNALDLSTDLEVALTSSDPSEAVLPATVTIPAGSESVVAALTIIDDALVDADQTVYLIASADSHVASNKSLTVTDDDVASLSLSILTPTLGEAEGEGRAVLHRNVANTDLALIVGLSAASANQLSLPQSVTIPAGQRSISFAFTPVDNTDVDKDRAITIEAIADGFVASQDVVLIVNDDVAPTLSLDLDRESLGESDAPPTTTLEDVGATLPSESFHNGSDMEGGFHSGQIHLNNSFDATFGSWGGWSVSNTTDATTPGFQNQYSAITAVGAYGSATYAVASAYPGGTIPTISIQNPQDGVSFQSLAVTNTTYAALSMADGDSFAKKFGGQTGDDPDFFLLTIDGRDANDALIGTVEFYLADFRFGDNSQDYVVDQWTVVDVSSLAEATRMEFSLSSSDNGDFGMNTPAYFAIDHVLMTEADTSVAIATVTRSDADLSEPLVIDLSGDDSTEATLPSTLTIPAGSMSATFAIQSVDDSVVDGPSSVVITASAASHTPSSTSIVVEDDDVFNLTLSLSTDTVQESDGTSAAELLFHRNEQDLSSPLTIDLSGTGSGIDVPSTVTIPAGMASVVVQLAAIDNLVHDGQRVVTIEASADRFDSSAVSLMVEDDEIAGVNVAESDGDTTVSELLGQDSFQVSLSSQPLSDVWVDVIYSSDDVVLDVTRLTFEPQQWNQPQVVTVTGVSDLLHEDDEGVMVTLRVDAPESDPSFAPAIDMAFEVIVRDHQPATLRIGENDSAVFLADEDAGVVVASGDHADGLHVVANELEQTILVEQLELTSGLVEVDASGGDDTVIVQGSRFTTLVGGEGYDRLVLRLAESIELVDFLDSRVVGFEELIADNEPGAVLTIDGQQLHRVAANDGTMLIRIAQGQTVTFLGHGTVEEPVMVGDEFAQVVRFEQTLVYLISPSPWQNAFSKWDVNHSGAVTALDALAVVNQLARVEDPMLPLPAALDEFDGAYFDVSGDGRITALDALRIINELARQELGDSEAVGFSHGTRKASGDTDSRLSMVRQASIAPIDDSEDEKIALFSRPNDEAIRSLYPGR